jgi:EAL domain-containing protein (putative c-di-GMP-specific phosphodiesterase class I)
MAVSINWTGAGDVSSLQGVRGLQPSEVGVAFQPIVDMNGRLFAHEALARCRRPGFENPAVLFERAVAESGCGPLGRMIRDATFHAAGDITLFINLHPDELKSRWLVRPDDPLGFHSRPVYLEITETAAFTHHDLCVSVLKELCRRTHARLVIDDFGAGFSNLERVVELEPAVVKLDLALTRGIHMVPRKQIVVRHMVRLCQELGAAVVAEGVETPEELRCVRDLGVEYAQGYLLARPGCPPPVPVWPL